MADLPIKNARYSFERVDLGSIWNTVSEKIFQYITGNSKSGIHFHVAKKIWENEENSTKENIHPFLNSLAIVSPLIW